MQKTDKTSDFCIDAYTEKICLADNLSTYDPYDIWKTNYGLKTKDLFNNHRFVGAFPALFLAITDLLINNKLRWSYQKQEYPVVRALAAQIMIQKYKATKDIKFLTAAKMHLSWLQEHTSKGYSGACWGLGFKWPAAANVIYDANTPYATHTPYALEAFHLYTQYSGDDHFLSTIKSCFNFFEKDLCIMYEDDQMMATSYGTFRDRIATNAVSYTMMAYALFLSYLPDKKEYIRNKIQKLYRFIQSKQLANGSWLYTPDNNKSFVDCFHSCFIIKNLVKTMAITELPDGDQIIAKGYDYLNKNFYDKNSGLYKRFTLSNKISFIKYDLYDNSEMLGLFRMMNDTNRFDALRHTIEKKFIARGTIYSGIDLLSFRRNPNFMRWAVMPYLFHSQLK